MESLSPAPGNSGGGTAPPAPQSFDTLDADQLRECCEAMAAREKRIVELLGCGTPERIEHDLRNVMNELQLLRTVFEKQEG